MCAWILDVNELTIPPENDKWKDAKGLQVPAHRGSMNLKSYVIYVAKSDPLSVWRPKPLNPKPPARGGSLSGPSLFERSLKQLQGLSDLAGATEPPAIWEPYSVQLKLG